MATIIRFIVSLVQFIGLIFKFIWMILNSVITLVRFIPEGLNFMLAGLSALPDTFMIIGTATFSIMIFYFIYFTVRGSR